MSDKKTSKNKNEESTDTQEIKVEPENEPVNGAGQPVDAEEKNTIKDFTDKVESSASFTKQKIVEGASYLKEQINKADCTTKAKNWFRTWLEHIKTNFVTPDKELKGLNRYLSSLANLWNSGWTGQITIIVIILIVFWIFSSLF
ncbi:MAG: hypothetical protein GX811_12290 [Lentisphaerae bacterium]|nr:hypothetical protein [Lentisphaerota bacterium]